jgi:hypothetical protein
LEWLPFHSGLQTIFPDGVDLEPFKEEVFYIVKIEKFAQPIHHQTIQTLSFDMNPSLNPAFYLFQIRDEMEEGFPGILKKRLETLAMDDNTDIRCMIQDLEALHDPQFRLSWQVTRFSSFL